MRSVYILSIFLFAAQVDADNGNFRNTPAMATSDAGMNPDTNGNFGNNPAVMGGMNPENNGGRRRPVNPSGAGKENLPGPKDHKDNWGDKFDVGARIAQPNYNFN